MFLRIIKILLYSLTVLFLACVMVLITPPLWRRMVSYPRMELELNRFQSGQHLVEKKVQLKTWRGIMHAHSYLSHDSKGTLADIIPAAKHAGISFVFLTDHPKSNSDTLPKGYNGLYDSVLIVPGSEKQGFDAWPKGRAVFDWSRDRDSNAMEIVRAGGLVCYAHPEEPHNWGNRWYQGMEIYNFHADTKDEALLPLIVNFLINGRKYPQFCLREAFDEQGAILSRWDSLNTVRKIIGFSAADTHENQNFRARYISDGRLEWYGPNAKVIDTTRVSIWNRWLLSPPDQGGWVFRLMTDTYREGFNYVTNYVLADSLTVSSLSRNILKGHLYTAFKSLGDAEGFMYLAEGQKGELCGIMGDSVSFEQVSTLKAFSPLPGKFRLLHNGSPVDSTAYNCYNYSWSDMISKGAYRIEIHILLDGRDVPWLYSNPVYIY